MCSLCAVLIGFVARSNISLEVKLVLNQTGLGPSGLFPEELMVELSHKDSLWHCAKEQSASSYKFDHYLKANRTT